MKLLGSNPPYRASRELTKGNFATKKKITQKDDMETAQEKIKRPVANKERFTGDSEPGLAQRVQERTKKKRRSGRRALSEADRKKRRRARETRPHAARLALRER